MRKPGFLQRRLQRFYALFTAFMGMLIFSTQLNAQGDLMLMPRRVVFEGSKRFQELNLANTGRDTARYIISLVNIRMKENGSFENITVPDSGQNFAGDFVRFFPRSVTLPPNESQAVKIQITKSNELTPGEYRSHMYFRSIPKERPLGETDSLNDSTISVRLVPIFGLSIPVIIRIGESTSTVRLSNLSVERTKDTTFVLKLSFNRSGNMSVYGDVTVDFMPWQAKPIQVALVKGVAVYTPNTLRKLRLPLDKTKGINYRTGRLHITYYEQQSTRMVKLAEADVYLH